MLNRKLLPKIICGALLSSSLIFTGCDSDKIPENTLPAEPSSSQVTLHDSVLPVDSLPPFSGVPYTVINNNVPLFKDRDINMAKKEFVNIAPLDSLGRCGSIIASLSAKTMPVKLETAMGDITPTGWRTVKYTGIEGNFLYNRCLLLPSSLAGIPNNVEREIITGTRYLCKVGMVSFTDMIYKYLQKSENHVLYRATPIFSGSDMVARGILLEAYSVEDHGKGINFCCFVYNNQPGIIIDYSNGDSKPDNDEIKEISTIVTTELNSEYDSTKNKTPKKK